MQNPHPHQEVNPQKARKGLNRVLHAGGYSIQGLHAGWGETAFRQEAILAMALVPLAFWLEVSPVERALMIAVGLLSLIVELFNSAVEAAIDRISLDRHPLSKNAKDMGSAAQFTALSLIALVWAIILLG